MISDSKEKSLSQAVYGNDNRLLKDLLEYDGNGKYIFIGDACQLPPVNQTLSPALSKDYLYLGMRIVRERWGARWADRGYTSTPENWTLFYCNGDISTQHTHTHAWSAGASAFLMRGLLGIEIVEPGFRAIRLNPRTPDHDCSLHLLTPRGMIDAEFRSGKWKICVPDTIVIKE